MLNSNFYICTLGSTLQNLPKEQQYPIEMCKINSVSCSVLEKLLRESSCSWLEQRRNGKVKCYAWPLRAQNKLEHKVEGFPGLL